MRSGGRCRAGRARVSTLDLLGILLGIGHEGDEIGTGARIALTVSGP